MERERQKDREIAIKKYPERKTDRQRQTDLVVWGVGATEERFERAARRVRPSVREKSCRNEVLLLLLLPPLRPRPAGSSLCGRGQ
jgi:hypothetical protein